MSKARMLRSAEVLALTAVLIACSGAARGQGQPSGQVVPFDEAISALTPAQRDDLQRSMATYPDAEPGSEPAKAVLPFEEAIAKLSPAERDELQRSMAGYPDASPGSQ